MDALAPHPTALAPAVAAAAATEAGGGTGAAAPGAAGAGLSNAAAAEGAGAAAKPAYVFESQVAKDPLAPFGNERQVLNGRVHCCRVRTCGRIMVECKLLSANCKAKTRRGTMFTT